MKAMTKEQFKAFTRKYRKSLPSYNKGRNVICYDEYSKSGKRILASASRWDGDWLEQVYTRPSDAKRAIFEECWQMYCNDKDASTFGICSHNTMSFTVSWVTPRTEEHPAMVIYLTRDHEYIVLCNE